MNKKEVQKRVLQNGKPLALSKFNWDEKTNTFSSIEDKLVIDFNDINNCTFDTGYSCTFDTGADCTFKTGSGCTFDTGSGCTFDTGADCTFNTGYNCTFDTEYNCTFNTESGCTFKTGSGCTFDTGYNCTFKTGSGCTFDTGADCTFNTGEDCTFKTWAGCTFKTWSDCTFKTGYNCTFNTGEDCTFKTWSDCTFKTGYNCTFDTGADCVVVTRNADILQTIQLKENCEYKIAPYNIKGYLKDGIYSETGRPAIIYDGILSEVISQKGNIYKVINYGETKETFIVKDGDIYSHGETLEQAKESLIYKISNRDTTPYESWQLTDTKTKEELIKAYRVITGACESGTKYFCENTNIPDKCTVKEAIELTKGQYNNEKFKEFFKGVR